MQRQFTALPPALTEAFLPELPDYYRGKVRDNYNLPDGRRVLISTDRQSAFDRTDIPPVPCKGQVLTQTAAFWFEKTKDIVDNHVLEYPDPNVVIARTLDILPVEMVVRDYMTGTTGTSIWTQYESGTREMYGIRFPEGMRKNEKLAETIITPTTKAPIGEHDEPISAEDIIARKLLTKKQRDEVYDISLRLFARGREIAAQHGLILVDTKYEFGVDKAGKIVLADEIHTPDSSRYWIADGWEQRFAKGHEPENLDKEFLRRWIREHCDDPYKSDMPHIPAETIYEFSKRYISLYEVITGQTFVPADPGVPVLNRIRKNLSPLLAEYSAPTTKEA